MPIVPGPADTGQRTHPFDPIMIALPLHLRLDHRVDGVSPGSPVFRRRSLTCRKAARKKSRSSCCWPIFRSNSAIRLSETVASDDGAADTSSNRRELFNGRPISRSAAAPPDRYFRRHSYSRSRPTPSSAASAATLTGSPSRDSARSLNSRVHRVLVFDTLVLLREQCASFPCLSSGVHSSPVRQADRQVEPQITQITQNKPRSAILPPGRRMRVGQCEYRWIGIRRDSTWLICVICGERPCFV